MTNTFDQVRRVAKIALVGGVSIMVAGWAAEMWWFGRTDDSSFARVERAVRRSFDDRALALLETTRAVASHPDISADLTQPAGRLRLFELSRAAVDRFADAGLSITVYDDAGLARAWAGRPSEIPDERILGDRAYFVAPGPLGLRLVYVEPILVGSDANMRRVGAVAGERVLSPALGLQDQSPNSYQLTASIANARLRTLYEGAGTIPGTLTFPLQSPDGDLLLEADVLEGDLVAARNTWRRSVLFVTMIGLAFALVVGCATLLARPRRGYPASDVMAPGLASATGCVLAYGLVRGAFSLDVGSPSIFDPSAYQSGLWPGLLRMPADVVSLGLLSGGLVLVSAFVVDQVRVGGHARRRLPSGLLDGRLLAWRIAGGAGLASIVLLFDAFTRDAFQQSSVDLLHLSLQPWSAARITMQVGLLLLGAAALWGGVTVLVASQIGWQLSHRRVSFTVIAAVTWLAPGSLVPFLRPVSDVGYLVLLGGSVAVAIAMPFVRPRFRHASHATRMLTMFLAILCPALLVYPSLLHYGEATKRDFVEDQAPLAATHPEQLQQVLARALEQIDGLQSMIALETGPDAAPDTDRAFLIWRQTDLARLRATSAVELYGEDGRLVSRFALNFPEYSAIPLDRGVTPCQWEIFGEILPFGSDERRVLHAERALCPAEGAHVEPGHAPRASVIVHVAFDYNTLPFISSQNPYTELLRSPPLAREPGSTGRDVEMVIYGWGLQPVFSSGHGAWSLSDALFERIYASREPFWTTMHQGDLEYSTYLVNNREGIYALGFPVFNLFDHLVHLAEVSTIAGLLFVLLTVTTGVGSWLTPNRHRFGRALLREVRTSFYRRLLLAFIAATVIPVLALAFVIRGYFATELRAGVEAGAARTAAVAQRVIEDLLVLQQVGEERTTLINDDLLVVISQILDQDVNIFRGSQLVATSERDLFASGVLPTRTPDAVFSSVVLERQPSYVMEDLAGALRYLVAATPIRAAGADAVLTVPLASQQQDIERQIEDLDRGILLGVALFILIGGAGGLYMAERIADPVQRLTRATGQIARGDFDAQVAVRSADEFQRLVASFNKMAVDLKRQQGQLEKTHRLEAWADMARQVAHEIKNPLTPVQLSAEHLLQVHADRGEPLGPVLRSCVDTILTQVRLLRQISSEFSSYATSPRVTLKPTSVRDLVTGVVDPYLVGLENRIAFAVDVADSLPALSMDQTLVGRALTNILENALHAMPGSGALTVRAVESAGLVTLTVTDTGVGLDRETLQRIFEPYFSTKVTGTGLGMAIAKRNVELNGGTIAVESEPGVGTTVSLAFPCQTG